MRILVRLFWAFLFFTLFAFALNNSQEVLVHWFFGQAWRAPLVIVVLLSFALGCALGVLAMVPAWWRHKRAAARHSEAYLAAATAAPASPDPLLNPGVRDGL